MDGSKKYPDKKKYKSEKNTKRSEDLQKLPKSLSDKTCLYQPPYFNRFPLLPNYHNIRNSHPNMLNYHPNMLNCHPYMLSNRPDMLNHHPYMLQRKAYQIQQTATANMSSFHMSLITHLENLCNQANNSFFNDKKHSAIAMLLPSDEYEDLIVTFVEKNQVMMISADIFYSLSEVIPSCITILHSNQVIVCCEPDNLTTISVAQRCSQFLKNSPLSTRIGYETKDKSYCDDDTRILFVSREMLFRASKSDPLLSNYSVIIFHCELLKSIETDLLLERLRQCLSSRKNFKLILLSSTLDDNEKLQDYFSSIVNVQQLTIPNRLSKVKIVWKTSSFSSDKNYINEIVDTTVAIHIFNAPGDVLIFLPTNSDIKKVMKLLSSVLNQHQFNDVDCIPVNLNKTESGFLSTNTCKIYKRNIFLVSSCIQLLLPSVRYVIDTGIRRDLYYDQLKNTYLYTHMFISQNCAKLRKRCISYNTKAICYRLYSKEDYKQRMPLFETPEMLIKDPCHVMIKAFHYNSKDAMSSDYVHNFPVERRKQAFSVLEKSNLIREAQLEPLGRLIAKLPYRYEYSKLIVIGEQWGYAFEAIILVAFFLENTNIFLYEEGDSKINNEVEATKFQYSYNDSDMLTNLNVYYHWYLNGYKKKWCQSKNLNYRALQKVQFLLKSVISVFEKVKKKELDRSFQPEQERDWSGLIEILFNCFKDNLCVYTGHYRSGYCKLDNELITFLHPSSSIVGKTNLPKYVVYDHLKLTLRHFMMGVTSIPENLVLPNDENRKIVESQLMRKQLIPVVMKNIGVMSINSVLLGKKGKKLLQIENKIKDKIKCNSIIIDPSEEKGTVTLYVPSQHANEVESIVRSIMEKELEVVLNEVETKVLELEKGPFKISLDISLGKGAIIETVHVINTNHNTLKECKLSNDKNSFVKFSINMTWMRRMCRGTGYVVFNNSKDFSLARRLCSKSMNVGSTSAIIVLDEKHINQFYVSGLSEETTNEDLLAAVNKLLKQLSIDVNAKTAFVTYKTSFETSENECTVLQQKLHVACSEILCIQDINIVVPKPENAATIMKAFININTLDFDKSKIEILNQVLKIDGLAVKAQPVYYATLMCSDRTYAVTKGTIEMTLKELKRKFISVLSISNDDEIFKFKELRQANSSSVCLKLLTNNLDILSILQRTISHILEGEILNCQTFSNLRKFFSHVGHAWLKDLQTRMEIYVVEEYRTKTLRLHGSFTNTSRAIQEIKKYLHDADDEIVKKIDLFAGKYSRVLIQLVIKNYGVQLKKFISNFRLRSATLNIRDSQLELHGRACNIEKAMCQLETLARNCSVDAQEELISSQEICCTCGVQPFQKSLRLEHCGHLYCAECIDGLITSAEFPICCCAQNCDKELILEDICKGLNYEDDKIKNLLNRALSDYISRNDKRFVCCPAADCSYFYDIQEVTGKKWTCSLCQNEICTKCNVVYHQGYSCEMYEKFRKDPDYSLKVWMKENEKLRKSCPKCKITIEKNGGCNHMECRHCKAHFCWLCTTPFPNSDAVYDHQVICPNRYQ